MRTRPPVCSAARSPSATATIPTPWDKDIPEARVGPMRGSERVIRGGSFDDTIERCRVTSRWTAGPETHLKNVGFRTVLPLPPES